MSLQHCCLFHQHNALSSEEQKGRSCNSAKVPDIQDSVIIVATFCIKKAFTQHICFIGDLELQWRCCLVRLSYDCHITTPPLLPSSFHLILPAACTVISFWLRLLWPGGLLFHSSFQVRQKGCSPFLRRCFGWTPFSDLRQVGCE